ncbi:cytochrome P450-dit2 [Coelomomyces lativittatus]|nr:cytochrome P450-dit2 [Coelomomyces lativittatus]KAJ1511773.1 cytochrome P450-dit2 [Coelomomyces lativittatus]KAJ1515309.1 cytochrome P450-dit2 [Coelomomyces lativittatus]
MEVEDSYHSVFQSIIKIFASIVTISLSYLIYKVYKSTIVPKELSSLPRVPILATLKAQLLTKGGFINETSVITNAVSEWCIAHGKDKDAWKDMYLIWLFGTWGVVLGKPDYIRTLFSNTDAFPKFLYKDVGFFLNDKFLGTNVILSNGDTWKRHRKIANPAFHRNLSTTVMGDTVRVLIQKLDMYEKQPVDCFDWMQRLTLDILSLAAFGKNLDSLQHPESPLVRLYNSIMKDLQLPIFMLFPILQRMRIIPFVNDLTKRIDQFDEFIFSVIEEKEREVKKRLENGTVKDEGEKDLLEIMLEVSMNDPTFTRYDLRSNVVIFFLAGHDTTASSLTTILYFLGMKKELQDKARIEVIDIMGELDPNTASDHVPYPTTQEQGRMDYLAFVIKEALRLYPSVTGLPLRRTSKSITLGSCVIPQGTPIHVDIFGVQRDPCIWGQQAKHFIPERWEQSRTGGAQFTAATSSSGLGESSAVTSLSGGGKVPMMPSAHGFTWVPFGGGQRMCLGQQFSLIEQRVILAMLLLRYEWSVKGDAHALQGNPLTASGVLFHPVGVTVEFSRRN